ncbi:MAG: RES family NAD+ phosphorylase [Candidatus Binataceae bacterium]
MASANLKTERKVLRSHRGRFHEHREAEPTSYAAESMFTAWREVTAPFSRTGLPADPMEFRAWRITLPKGKTVDLTDSNQRSRYKIATADLEADVATARCKEVALEIRRSTEHYIGILYRSVRDKPKGLCIAIFLENLPPGVKVTSVDQEKFLRKIRKKG